MHILIYTPKSHSKPGNFYLDLSRNPASAMQKKITWACKCPFTRSPARSNGLGKHLDTIQHRKATQMLESKCRNSKKAAHRKGLQRNSALGTGWSEFFRICCLITKQGAKTSKWFWVLLILLSKPVWVLKNFRVKRLCKMKGVTRSFSTATLCKCSKMWIENIKPLAET